MEKKKEDLAIVQLLNEYIPQKTNLVNTYEYLLFCLGGEGAPGSNRDGEEGEVGRRSDQWGAF